MAQRTKIFKTKKFWYGVSILVVFLTIIGVVIYSTLPSNEQKNKPIQGGMSLLNFFPKTIIPIEKSGDTTTTSTPYEMTTSTPYEMTTISPYTSSYMDPSLMDACYSMRLVVPTYTGPVIRVEMDDGTVNDFYTDATQSYMTTGPNNTGTLLSALVGVDVGNGQVRIWYDQSGHGNHAVSDTTECPYIEKDMINSISTKYVLGFTYVSGGRNYFLTLEKPIKPYSIFSQFYWNKSATGSYGTIISSSTNSGFGVRFYNKTLNSEQNEYDWFYKGSGDKYSLLNGSLTNQTLELKKWTTLCLSVETPENSTVDIIGADTASSSRSISGYITEMIFYKRQLTTTEMEEYYNNKFDLGI